MRSLSALFLSSALAAQGGGGPTPQPLPPLPVPAQNQITPEKTVLGKLLFWEEQMSTDNRVACGTCHTFAAGGGDTRRFLNARGPGIGDDVFASPGLRRSDPNNDFIPDPDFRFAVQVTGRASPSFLTGAWFTELFWDGRAGSTFVDPDTGVTLIPAGGALENQALGPLLSPVEMVHDAFSFAQLTAKLADVEPMALAVNLPVDMANAIAGGVTYPDLFQAAFGSSTITAARIAMAIATYERSLVPDQTPYDAFVGGNPAALTPQQVNGLNVFTGPGRCVICHTTGLFSDDQYHNLGLRPIAQDNGRQSVTGSPADAGRFKTPSLRNVGLRNTFMHTGQFTSMQQVFGFYLNGGGPNLQNKDPQMIPLNVGPQAAADLIDFVVNGLTDPRVAAGVAPFDRPVLRSQILGRNGSQYGLATAGSGGLLPEILPAVPANLGNINFKVGVHNARGAALSTLVLGTAPTASVLSGVNLNVALTGGELLVPWALSGPSGLPGAGFGTLRVVVPDDPALSGLMLYAQWFIWDSGVATGAAATRGARIDLF